MLKRSNDEFDRRIRQIGLISFFVVAASMGLFFIIFRASILGKGIAKVVTVLRPIIYGFIIAYILNPVMISAEKIIYKFIKKHDIHPGSGSKKAIRACSILVALLIMVLLIYGLISIVVPQLIISIRNIFYNIPAYTNTINEFMDSILSGNEQLDETTTALIEEYADKLQQWMSSQLDPRLDSLAAVLTGGIFDFVNFLKNFFLGLIISIYMLLAKDGLLAKFRRIVYALFPVRTGNRILHSLRFVDEKFGGFFIGKIIDSVIIGIICYFCLTIMKMPYTVLVAVVIGVTNIVPFFGPFIGAIPSTLLIFVVSPMKALIFIVFVVILQQFDGNILGPRILGSSVGVSSFMVVLSIIIGGGFLGVTGMVIGVPISAVLAAIIQGWILRRMRQKKLPGDLESYHYVSDINPQTREFNNGFDDSKPESLYDKILYRSADVRSFDEPIVPNKWDRTMKEIDEEDRIIEGYTYDHYAEKTRADKGHSSVFEKAGSVDIDDIDEDIDDLGSELFDDSDSALNN